MGRFLMNVMLASGRLPVAGHSGQSSRPTTTGVWKSPTRSANIETFSKFLGNTLKQVELQTRKLPEPYNGNFPLDDQFIEHAKQSGAQMIVVDANIVAYLMITGRKTALARKLRETGTQLGCAVAVQARVLPAC